MSVSTYLENAGDAYDTLEELQEKRQNLMAEISEEQQKVEENIVEELYRIQEDLDSGENYTLMRSEETGRGGMYSFDEVLTSDGIEAQNVCRNGEPGHDSSEMYLWQGNWDSYNEPLDIESEYFVGERNSFDFTKKLYKRIKTGEIPESSFFYD